MPTIARAPRRARFAALAAGVTLALHFAWEMAQAPAFRPFAATAAEATLHCFRAAVWDTIIAAAAYGITAIVLRRWSWPLDNRTIAGPLLWIAIGVCITIGYERFALATGRWQYGPGMPVVFGLGLWPLAQWIVISIITLLLVRRIARAWQRSG